MSVFVIDKDNPQMISEEERHPEVQVISYRKVLDNGKLVEGVFRWSDEFSLFSQGNLESNYHALRKIKGLKTNEDKVESLIAGFTISVKGSTTHVPVDSKKLKSALFLFHIADGDETFDMDERKQMLARAYFGFKFCDDVLQDENTSHTTVKSILNKEGVTITIHKPIQSPSADIDAYV